MTLTRLKRPNTLRLQALYVFGVVIGVVFWLLALIFSLVARRAAVSLLPGLASHYVHLALLVDSGGCVDTAQPACLAACLSLWLAPACRQSQHMCRLRSQGSTSVSHRLPCALPLPAPIQCRWTGLRLPSHIWMHS